MGGSGDAVPHLWQNPQQKVAGKGHLKVAWWSPQQGISSTGARLESLHRPTRPPQGGEVGQSSPVMVHTSPIVLPTTTSVTSPVILPATTSPTRISPILVPTHTSTVMSQAQSDKACNGHVPSPKPMTVSGADSSIDVGNLVNPTGSNMGVESVSLPATRVTEDIRGVQSDLGFSPSLVTILRIQIRFLDLLGLSFGLMD
ncbi:hypothetical protein V6N11_070214 [Hibiscus sabdariffa]|uniref:Uncharacterized protein n=1 Tax=Hibiscus sabdariffa TaxID=183260 RepID=A0ABR2QEC3_9ROSI